MLVLFDIDGTLADISHRLHFVKHPEFDGSTWIDWTPDWDTFHDPVNVAKDEYIPEMVSLFHSLDNYQNKLVLVTGRPERLRQVTQDWIYMWVTQTVPFMFMRPDGDHRPDYQIKNEMLDTIGRGYVAKSWYPYSTMRER